MKLLKTPTAFVAPVGLPSTSHFSTRTSVMRLQSGWLPSMHLGILSTELPFAPSVAHDQAQGFLDAAHMHRHWLLVAFLCCNCNCRIPRPFRLDGQMHNSLQLSHTHTVILKCLQGAQILWPFLSIMGPTVTKIVALPKATSVVGSHGMFWARVFFCRVFSGLLGAQK